MIDINFHDGAIKGIFYNEKNNHLTLAIELSNYQKIALAFIQVLFWDFSPFEMQNVLFNLHEFNATTLPKWLQTELNMPTEYIDLILSGEKKLFYLEPSVGLGGYVVAKESQTALN